MCKDGEIQFKLWTLNTLKVQIINITRHIFPLYTIRGRYTSVLLYTYCTLLEVDILLYYDILTVHYQRQIYFCIIVYLLYMSMRGRYTSVLLYTYCTPLDILLYYCILTVHHQIYFCIVVYLLGNPALLRVLIVISAVYPRLVGHFPLFK